MDVTARPQADDFGTDQGAQRRHLTGEPGRTFDVFISHASEDKAVVARPLSEALSQAGYRVWLDESELTLGDELGRKIDLGLTEARFGLVVLSPSFFAKEWPRKELDGLVARETADGQKVILPVWHRVTFADVLAYSPILASRLAVSTSDGLPAVVAAVERAMGARDQDT